MDARLIKFMQFAISLKDLSKCEDKHVAAIITDKNLTQVYSIGINGGPKKGFNCLCKLGQKYSCIHAEAQAIAKNTSTDTDKVMFCTFSPCVTCAALIVNTGFSRVYYNEEYKHDDGLKILRDAGIRVEHLVIPQTENSVIIDKLVNRLANIECAKYDGYCPPHREKYMDNPQMLCGETRCAACKALYKSWYKEDLIRQLSEINKFTNM